MEKKSNVRIMTECAVLIALATVLSLIKIVKMPLGGSITLISMLPICVASFRNGLKWGMGTSFVYSIIQLILGITMDGLLGWGLTAAMLIGCILFDYVIPFTVLGITGSFRKSGEIGFYVGVTLTFILRFISHFISGYVIFSNLDQWEIFGSVFENAPALYSITYNSMYLLPELIITIVVSIIMIRIPGVKKSVFGITSK